MWMGLGMLFFWTAVILSAVWFLTRLFPKGERPCPPNPAHDSLDHWRARFERGEISQETFATIQRFYEQDQLENKNENIHTSKSN